MYKLIILLEGVLPAFLLLCYIYWKDRAHPEPFSQLKRGVKFGVISIFLSFLFSGPGQMLGFYNMDYDTLMGSVKLAFWGAAIPEETAKLIMLWLLLRRNPYFDERMDAIVYAVCVSMGFAALENVSYLLTNEGNVQALAIQRAFFSVPGHFAFAVLMGYYYGLVYFDPARYGRYRLLVWVAPVLAHGIFDMLLMAMPVFGEAMQAFIYISFIFFCIRMHIFCSRRIRVQLGRDFNDTDQEGYSKDMGGYNQSC